MGIAPWPGDMLTLTGKLPGPEPGRYCIRVSTIYSAEYAPDPYDALDVLAFVLCPVRAFAPTGDPAELEAAAEMIAPAKEEAIRRWLEAQVLRTVN